MLREWAEHLLELAGTPWGPVILVSHAFLESFILPVAHDFFLIAVSLAKPKMSLVYALMSTIASTLGNMVGYAIGNKGGKPLLDRMIKGKTLLMAKELLHRYDVWATAIACFTPFPDKVFSVCAGAFHLNFRKFVVVVFFARAARFYLVAFAVFFWGARARDFLLEYLPGIMIGFLVFMLVSAAGWKIFEKWLARRWESQNPSGGAA